MTDTTTPPAQKLIVPSELWKQIATTIGSYPWNEVRNLRRAVHNAFGEAGIDFSNPATTPPHLPVAVDLFNAASNFLGSKEHDVVDAVMTNIENFITSVQNAAAAAVAETSPMPTESKQAATTPPLPVSTTDVADVEFTEVAPT